MTINEFRQKCKTIEDTHPVPAGYTDAQKVRFHSKIKFEWLEQLKYSDIEIALKETRSFTEKM